MNIIEACKKTTEEKKFIQSERLKEVGIKIEPTDTELCCVYYKNNVAVASRWNPAFEDLISDSYEVVS